MAVNVMWEKKEKKKATGDENTQTLFFSTLVHPLNHLGTKELIKHMTDVDKATQ